MVIVLFIQGNEWETCVFGVEPYIIVSKFFVMSIKKIKLRSRLTHRHMNDILKLAATQEVILIYWLKLKDVRSKE